MQAIERTLQERQRFVKSKLAAEGVPPTPPQLVAFLRGLVNMIRPHTGRELCTPQCRRPAASRVLSRPAMYHWSARAQEFLRLPPSCCASAS